MALTLYNGGRCDSLWDAFWPESSWEPLEIVLCSPSRSSAKRARNELKSDSTAKRTKSDDRPKVDWLETDGAHVFKADLPGLKREEIKVELKDELVLQISGEQSQEEEKEGGTWHTVERSHGKFIRRFKLPGTVQAESVSAKVEDGVLTVTIPKAQAKTPETRSIQVA